MIRQETKDGKVLVDMAMKILRGEKIPNLSGPGKAPYRVKLSDVKWALRFLAEHGFGRLAQTVELKDTGPSPQTLEIRARLRALSTEDLTTLLAIQERARKAIAAAEAGGGA